MRRYGNKKRTRRDKEMALATLLTMRDDLNSIDMASVARSYGVTEGDLQERILKEKRRRLRA
ncbi:MAG: hypothetical protein HKN38_06135 [Altererythrobacter sp.]|nr:hypothetical protein [Altererythrobacter sp.]